VWVSLAVLVALVVLDAIPGIVDKKHAHTAMEHVPAFWTVFGLLGCLLLVIISKAFGRLGISTREDYYDE
jgi:phage-related holin